MAGPGPLALTTAVTGPTLGVWGLLLPVSPKALDMLLLLLQSHWEETGQELVCREDPSLPLAEAGSSL